ATMYASVMKFSWFRGGSDECRNGGDGTSDDEGVHVIGALEGVHGFGVGEVARDTIVELDTVSAADLPAAGHDIAHSLSHECLRHSRVMIALLALILQLRDAHAQGDG